MKPPNHGCKVTVYFSSGARMTGYLTYDGLGAPSLKWSGLALLVPDCTPQSVETYREVAAGSRKGAPLGDRVVLVNRYAPVANLVRKPKLEPLDRRVN